MADLLARLAPDQAGALWIGFLVAFLVLGDHARLLSRRNAALLALLSIAPFLYDILDVRVEYRAWAFRAIFVLTGGMAVWGVLLSRGAWAPSWRPNLGIPALRVATLCAVVAGTAAVLTRPPDDAGTYTNLGAQRWTETGHLPYGDDKLKGPDSPAFGAAATYGPVLYVVHIPFQLILGRRANDPSGDPLEPGYVWPRTLATQLASWSLFLVGLAGFFLVVRRLADPQLAWGAVAVMAALPYFVGLGGGEQVIGGLRFVSHIAPMAITLLAFLWLDRPVVAGALLATGAGALYYPAFFFPIWLAWYFFRGEGWRSFALGFAGAGAVIAAVVVLFTETATGESAIRLFLESTLEHQEGAGPLEYGASSFSFWTHHPGLAAVFQTPLLGDTSLFKLSFLMFAGFCLSLAALTKGRSPAQLAALTAAAAAAVQLWKTHATGSYVEWYLPFLMIALFTQAGIAPTGEGKADRDAEPSATPVTV
jgi:hypothetical protein